MREKSPTIKIYELGNKKNKYRESKDESLLINELTPTQVIVSNDNLASETLLTNFLHTNPFLYNPKTTNIKVDSIEDFIIETKHEKIALGDILRNSRYSPKQRKRIINNSFKKWKKDYQINKKTVFKENDKVVEVIGEISYLNYSWKAKVLLIFTFLLMLFLVITDSLLWNVLKERSVGYFLFSSLVGMYSNMYWVRIIGNLGIYLLLLLIFFSTIYSFIIKDFKKNYRLAQSFLNSSEKSISKNFKKKYNKARKYYVKRVDEKKYPYFPPLSIEEVQEGKISIKIFDDICKSTIDRAYKVKKTRPYIVVFNKFLQYTGYGCSVVIVVMSLYSMISKIFSS